MNSRRVETALDAQDLVFGVHIRALWSHGTPEHLACGSATVLLRFDIGRQRTSDGLDALASDASADASQ
jgi:hypothetical protein